MYQLGKHVKLSNCFKASEFACKDGSFLFPDYRLVELLQKIREHFKKSVVVHSAYRSKEYNARIKGAPQSQHLFAKAADISVYGITPTEIAHFAESILKDSGGIGVYSGFTHVDVREKKSRWEERAGEVVAAEGF